MAIDCGSCDDLRTNAPEYTQQGVTNKVCNYLKNNTGLGGKSDNCHDLDDANDCTIGLMDGEIEAYDPCEWKEFMHKFIPNLHAFNKAMVCDTCGTWSRIERLECLVDLLFNGVSFRIGEKTDGDAYAVAGKGISFLAADGGGYGTTDLYLAYIAGGYLKGGGSFIFHTSDFTDLAPCGNFDDGETMQVSANRLGNSIWGNTGRPVAGGELIVEYRIKKSAYPQIKRMYTGFGIESGGGAYRVYAAAYDGDNNPPTYAMGQHGRINADGTPADPSYTAGHLVPQGWIYVQVRLTYADMAFGDGNQYTPNYVMGIRMNQEGTGC